MEDFLTEPKKLEVSFKREAMATATARYLTTELDKEVWVSNQTIFASSSASGHNETTFYVEALCTWSEMKDAAEQALCECVNHDSELINLGLLPQGEHGPNVFRAGDYF